MFDRYDTKILYISKSGEKDMFGFSPAPPVEKYVRYVGGKEVQVNETNAVRTENRLLYQCPFKVEEGDKFRIDGRDYEVKYVELCPDVFGNKIYWEVQII